MNVVLVHGIFDDGSDLQHLARLLRQHGHRCWVPVLTPADARTGLHALALQLQAYIARHLGPHAPFALIAFSMGSLVARHCVKHLGGAQRTRALFAISGPHRGTWSAYGYIGQGARDMRPGSAFLAALDASAAQTLSGIPLFAYWTPWDLTVFPAATGHWALAHRSVKANAKLHRCMPRDPQVCADIVAQLQALAAARDSRLHP